jgi:phosphoribosylaminoimidazolecarboxamide formyltransferase/IMP cyclohydrolase
MAEGNVLIRRALLSAFDKTGLPEFARALADAGVEIISSGGTAKVLEGAGIKVRQVQEWTGFPEMLGHRVVTLHPKVHGSILALRDNPQHQADIEKYGLEPIDLVCVGLYPFEQAIAKEDCTSEEAIEMIDIGGPTMVRAAAKNHKWVTVVTDALQYAAVLAEMQLYSGAVSLELRRRLAHEAFCTTMAYDVAISTYLAGQLGQKFPQRLGMVLTKDSGKLRYGENWHQEAAFFRFGDQSESSVSSATLLPGGKEISYNNYFDANGAIELVKEFDEPCVAIIKHANPAGIACRDDLVEAYRLAYLADANAAMGGIVAVNRPVTTNLAAAICESYQRWGKAVGAGGFFAEIIAAPGFEPGAVDVIRARKGWGGEVRLLELPPFTGKRGGRLAFKNVVGGLLVQDRDLLGLNENQWKVVTKRKPTDNEMADLRFAWLVCKHVKSNAIVLAKNLTLLGAGAGQMSRVNSARLATQLARAYGGVQDNTVAMEQTEDCVLASDAFFPFADSLDWAAEAGASAVIEPGGAKKDDEVIARADELDLAMIFTGTRHFNH